MDYAIRDSLKELTRMVIFDMDNIFWTIAL